MPDPTDFEAYVAARSARLHHLAYLLTRNWAGAEDLVQAALVKAWFAWKRIDGDPDPYVRRIIATTFTSWRRRRAGGEVITENMPDPGYPDPTGEYAQRDAIWSALGRLTARQRAVIVLRYFEDLSQEFVSKEPGSWSSTPSRRRTPRSSAPTSSAR